MEASHQGLLLNIDHCRGGMSWPQMTEMALGVEHLLFMLSCRWMASPAYILLRCFFGLAFGNFVFFYSWQPVIDYVETKYEEYLNAESKVNRKTISDNRVSVTNILLIVASSDDVLC